MAKAVATVEEKQNLPAVVDLEQYAGSGMEEVSVKDMAIPFLKILQTLSPEINKKKPEYIEGAEVGDICNTVTNKIYKSVRVVPCFFKSCVNEWKPNRGGFVGTHAHTSPVVVGADRLSDGTMRSKAGNDLVDTANWYVLIELEGEWTWGVIAFTSTQLKKSRKLMTQLQSIKMQGANGPFTPPLYTHVLNVTTQEESNDAGDWSGWKIELGGKSYEEPGELFQLAKDYNSQVTAGLVQAVPPVEGSSAPEAY